MKKYLWLLLVVSVLLCCTLVVSAASDAGTVVYVDATVETSGDGTTAAKAFKTLPEAYTALNGGDGTIVVCSNLRLSANKEGETAKSVFSAKTGNVVITGKDPKDASDVTYPVITIGTASSARYAEFFTRTEFSYVTLDKTNKGALYFLTGPSLTFAEGVEFTYDGAALTSTTSDVIGVRLGSHLGVIDAEYVQRSGTLGSVYGANTKFAVGKSTINLSGDAKLLVRMEGAGNEKNVTDSTINISDSAEVNALILGGYNSNVGSSKVTISGGSVNTITSTRPGSDASTYTVGSTTLAISGTASVGSITLDERHVGGNNTLTISNDQTFTGDFGQYWDTVSIGGDVTVNGAYTGTATGELTVNGLLTLNGSVEANTQTLVDSLNTANTGSGWVVLSGVSEPVTVYLNGTDGADTNGGTTAGDAVKTLTAAYALLKGGDGTIVICGDLEIASSDKNNTSAFSVKYGNIVYTGKDPVSGELYPVRITIKDGTNTDLVQIFTPTVFEYLTFDACTNNSVMFVTGESLTFGEGMTFLDNGKLITNVTTDEIVVRCGSKTEIIEPTFIMKSGAISSIYGGNQFKDSGETTIQLSGDAQVLVRLECGANGKSGTGYVEQMNLSISDNVYVNTLNLTGYANGDLGTSNTTITGGYIAKIWGQRSENLNLKNNLKDLNVTISGDTYFEEIDLGGINITGTATLTINDLADDLAFIMFDEYWDNIVIGDKVILHLDGAYPIDSNAKLSVGSGSILYLDPEANETVPAYTATGDGTGKVILDKHEGHTLTYVEPFCGENGRVEHWYCNESGCPGYGNCYSDAEGLTPMSKESTMTGGKHALKKLDPICSGHAYYKCAVCSEYFADIDAQKQVTEEEYLAATGHSPVWVDVKAPTCVTDGVLEAHWHCESCNWNFRDEDCTDLIKYSIIDPKTGHHNLQSVDAKDATCTEDGHIAHYACSDCGRAYTAATYGGSRLPLSQEKVTVKARHELTHVDAVAATDTAHGVAEYWHCTVEGCANYGKIYADAEGKEEVTLADLATHKLNKVPAVAATTTTEGNIEHFKCPVCDKLFNAAGEELTAEDVTVDKLIPETSIPETSSEPETTVPETSSGPETTVTEPETTVTEPTEPETSEPETTEPTEPEKPTTIIVYAKVPEGWENPAIWAWNDKQENAFDAWPGIAMTKGEDGWWYAEVPAWVENVIVNANSGSVQTGDLDLAVTGENIWVEVSVDPDGKVTANIDYNSADTADNAMIASAAVLMLLSAAALVVTKKRGMQ